MQTLLLKVLNSLLPCPTVHRDMLPSHSQDTSIQSHWSVPVKQFQESGEITKETPCLLTDLIAQLEQSLKKSRITEAQSLADILRLVSTGFASLSPWWLVFSLFPQSNLYITLFTEVIAVFDTVNTDPLIHLSLDTITCLANESIILETPASVGNGICI